MNRIYLGMMLLIATVGCGQSEPAAFRLNMPEIVTNRIVPAHQQAVADTLGALFGTPDEPFALPQTGLNVNKLKLAAGPVWSDEAGVGHGLYRQHCAHCHGITGDGRGPTAMFLNPYPRDYRPGVYKFKSTYNPIRPTDEDLRRVLMNGVAGTAMPSFALLPPAEIDALVEYVKYLSMRGQMESSLITYIADEFDFDPLTGEADTFDPASDPDLMGEIVETLLADVASGWEEAEDNVILPEEGSLPEDNRSPEQIAASVDAGRKLFYATTANCFSCHGPTGLGDGQQDDFTVWEKSVVAFLKETNESLPAMIVEKKKEISELDGEAKAEAKDELKSLRMELSQRQSVADHMFEPRNAIPRNLRQNVFRGGRRPLDIYRKIYTGIAGSPMPGGGPAAPGGKGALTEEQIWQLVDYVRSLSFEPASRPQKTLTNLEVVN